MAGSHAEVAKLLVEHCGAEITEHLAQKFPDFTAALLDEIYHPLCTRESEMQVRGHGSGFGILFGAIRLLLAFQFR